MTQISNAQKSLTIKYRACMLATVEYRKNMPMDHNKLKLPVNDDVADARALMYRANAIIHVYNDICDRKDAAEFFWTTTSEPNTPQPRLLLMFGKNKITSFNKTLYMDLDPNTVTLSEVRVERAKQDVLTYAQSSGEISNGKLIIDAPDWGGNNAEA
jgi:hypothetical protein